MAVLGAYRPESRRALDDIHYAQVKSFLEATGLHVDPRLYSVATPGHHANRCLACYFVISPFVLQVGSCSGPTIWHLASGTLV